MNKSTSFVPYREVLAQAGFSKRTLNERILTEGITTYVDGTDRRRRLIDVRDLPKLIEVRPAPQRQKAA